MYLWVFCIYGILTILSYRLIFVRLFYGTYIMSNGILLFGVKYYYYNYSSFSLSYPGNILSRKIFWFVYALKIPKKKKKLIN